MVSLMPLVAAWKNQLVERVQEQGGVFHASVTTRSTFAAFKTLWIHFHHPYIWQHFDAALYAFIAPTFTEICWTAHICACYNNFLSTNSGTEDRF